MQRPSKLADPVPRSDLKLRACARWAKGKDARKGSFVLGLLLEQLELLHLCWQRKNEVSSFRIPKSFQTTNNVAGQTVLVLGRHLRVLQILDQ